MSELDWLAVVVVVVLLPFCLLKFFPERDKEKVESFVSPDVDECRVVCWSASSHSLPEPYGGWTSMQSWKIWAADTAGWCFPSGSDLDEKDYLLLRIIWIYNQDINDFSAFVGNKGSTRVTCLR